MFETAVAFVLKHEGGYVNDPRDPGGETKYGISKRAYPNQDIRNLTVDQAKAIYRRDYWDVLPADLPDQLRAHLFDGAVNMGVSRSIRVLQQACGVAADGQWGPASRSALARLGEQKAIAAYATARILFYTQLNTFATYGRGWTRRVVECLQEFQ